MLKDLVTNKDYLNSLFTEKDFNFINSFDSEISGINSKITEQEKTRDKIVQFINSIANVLEQNSPDTDIQALYKLTDEVTKIFELINTNIQLLSSLVRQLNSLNSEIVTLLLDIENANNTDDYYQASVNTIKAKIDNYSLLLNETNNKLDTNNLRIKTFLSDSNTQHYLKDFNISIDDLSHNIFVKQAPKASHYNVNEKDNNILIISEKDNKVFLPYRVEEINDYLEQFPDQYTSFENVVTKEFILPLNYYMSYPVLARFREAYSLCRDREAKPILESLKYGIDLMFNSKLNPAIIAACKTQAQLANYLNCLEKNDLKSFTDFEIRFEMNPL
ncbi:MAG: hypothetical protein ACI4VQ_06630 [Clostridia bacterium]